METINHEDFLKVKIASGTILSAATNPKAIKPAYILEIDFGEYGIKMSSAQITQHYTPADLIGQQILAIVNFPTKRVAGITSEVLVLAVVSEQEGTVLIHPERPVPNGSCVL